MKDAARHAEIEPATFRSYVSREQAPEPDGYELNDVPWWWASTIRRWQANRPGRGRRTDRFSDEAYESLGR